MPHPPSSPRTKRASRALRIAAAVSVAVHLAALLAVLLLHRNAPAQPDPANQGAVELLMVEQKGADPSQAGQPAPPEAKPAPAPAEAKPAPAAKPGAKAAPAEPPPPAVADQDGDEPMPPEKTEPEPAKAEPAKEAEKPAGAPPAEPPATKGLVLSLEGTDSDTNAMVLDGRILPASPDDRFRNRPPPYPDDAAMRGEHGAVTVVIHVTPAGVASGADVVQSSGSVSLDRAAVTAVKRWRFHPAMKDGQQIPFDMAIRFDFEPY